ncbi:MAG: alkaline phosphatase PhoX [Imperialibacter sp.]|uniref:alkaline phosphatase PhoX n=1 Tax=Imperialibacter sp. TaxID=2038411 RepID=UPI003A8770D5
MKRRTFLYQTSVVSLGFLSLSRCVQKGTDAAKSTVLPLKADPKNYMDLPEGFSYKIISKAGSTMSDGLLVPGRADGMGTFLRKDGKVIIIRNHENSPTPLENSPFGLERELLAKVDISRLYDAGRGELPGLGGTTTLIYDEEKGEVIEEFMSLAGTYRNCAGGVTPWNSWLTCEEDTTKADGENIEKDHGYVFDVPADATGLVEPRPIKAMGRFNHEAVAVDPQTGIIYQTEDASDSLIYRFIPEDPKDLHKGGKLQALAVGNQPKLDTRNWKERGVEQGIGYPVVWQDVDDVDSPLDDLRIRGFEGGAACFARGEGMWNADGQIYFACTNGGPKNFGQIFRYDIEKEQLELFAESEDKTVLHMCDNVTIAPWGEVLVCEDNGELNRMHLISKDGELRQFAVNRSSKSELTGAVFSPSGKTLFVNVQENGDTLAITGPWEKLQAV